MVGDPVKGGGGEDGVDRLRRAPARSGRRPGSRVAGPQRLAHLRRSSPRSRRPRAGWPRGSRSISRPVTRPLPQPASSTVSSPRSGAGRAPPCAHSSAGRRPRGRSPRPTRGRGVHRPRSHHSAVVTGPCAGRRRLEAVDRAGVLQRDADVVEAVQQAVLDVGLDRELEDAGGAGDRLVVDVDPGLAGLGDGVAVLLVEDRRQQPDLRAVGVEDVGEGRRDDRLEAEVLQRPGGVLAGGAAAEVRAR